MNFGDLYKKKIEREQFGDAAKHWKELEKRLDAAMPVTQKKRGFFWMYFAIMACVTTTVALFVAYEPNTNMAENKSNISTLETAAMNPTNTSAETKDATSIQRKADEAASSSATTTASQQNTSNTSNQETSTPTSSRTSSSQASPSKRLPATAVAIERPQVETNSSSPGSNRSVQQAATSSKAEVNVTNTAATRNTQNETAKQENASNKGSLQKEVGMMSTPELTLAAAQAIDLSALTSSIAPKQVDVTTTTQEGEQKNNGEKNELADKADANTSANSNEKNNDKIITPDNTNNKDYARKKLATHVSAGLYGGGMYCMKQLYSFVSSNSNHQIRNTNELANTWTYQMGADVNYHIGKFVLSTGLNYHSQNQVRNINNAFYRDIETDSIATTINQKNYWQTSVDSFSTLHISSSWVTTPTAVNYYDANAGSYSSGQLATCTYVVDTQTIYHHLYDSVFVPSDTIYTHLVNSNVKKIAVSSMKNLSGVNYIRYIEIPVMIGYQLQFNKLSVMIRTGIGFGRFSKQSNYYINSTETDLVAKQDNDFRKMMYNYLLRVGVSYMITPQFGINFEPMFRSNLSSVFNNANEFQQRFKNVGANMGVTYSFK